MEIEGSWVRRGWDRLLMPPRRVRPMGLIAIQMSINPFELFLLISVVLAGLAYALGFPPPGSVQQLLPAVAVRVWAANLGIGGLFALVGGLWTRNLEKGLASYQFGWGLVGTATLVYGIALIAVFPVAALYPAISNLFFASACLTRVVQVQRFFRLSRAASVTDLRGTAGGLGALVYPAPPSPGSGEGGEG